MPSEAEDKQQEVQVRREPGQGEEKQKGPILGDVPAAGWKAAAGALSSIADVDPYSIEDARAVMAKREVQKKEKVPLFEMRRQVQLTFDALGKWYLELESVKALASYARVKKSPWLISMPYSATDRSGGCAIRD